MDFFNSSAIDWIDYDSFQQTLDVGFTGGHAGRYFAVPPERYRGLRDDWSPGRYFNEFIKGVYRYENLS